ncbi:MAG: hypothetical protein RLP09_13270 [Sandaracinaceae bacterium]|nr:hypothetical protein [Myxococcales bacterium]
MQTKVSLSTDIAVIVWLPVISPHDFVPGGPTPPLPPPSPVGLAVEVPVNMAWPASLAMGKAKLTSTVFHLGWAIVQEGHDCGPMIPHMQIAPAPTNALTVIHVLTASRKSQFSAGEIKANKKPLAHCILTNLPPTPMTNCGKPMSPPGTDSPSSHANSLVLGVHIVDLIAGWVTIGVQTVFDMATSSAPSNTSANALDHVTGTLASSIDAMLFHPFETFFTDGPTAEQRRGDRNKFLRANIAANATSLTRLAGQFVSDYHGDGGVSLGHTNGFWSTGMSVTRSGEDGRITSQVTGGAKGPFGLGSAQVQGQSQTGGNAPDQQSLTGTAGIGGVTGTGGVNSNDGWTGSGTWNPLDNDGVWGSES